MEFILEVQSISFFLNINIYCINNTHECMGITWSLNTLLIPDIGIPIASLCSHVDWIDWAAKLILQVLQLHE